MTSPILTYLAHRARYGEAPSEREIAAACAMTRHAVRVELARLVDAGQLRVVEPGSSETRTAARYDVAGA